ncbi:MAG: MFS transporter [Opitutales bacterium]|nr:MFS transporter [Opitutales bacterium]
MKNRSRVLFVCGTFSLSLLLYIDRTCISVAKGPIAESLNLSDTQMGWVLSAFALGYALAQTPSGYLADRFGPRIVLSGIVTIWSLFTALTGAAFNYLSLLIYRFLFGVGESGAFPSMARASFSWIPLKERGLVTGINFSGSRLGAAFALPLMAWLISAVGWRNTFYILGGIGIFWAVAWWYFFRDNPEDHKGVSEEEKAFILENRQKPVKTENNLNASILLSSPNMWFTMIQYFCSNFTFFFSLTWLFPYIKETYDIDAMQAGWLTSLPLIGGAFGNWISGYFMDFLYGKGHWVLSRRLTAIIGFALAAIGLIGSMQMESAMGAVLMLTIAIFGADMTLSPSWSFCVDIGAKNAGVVSGTMNMAGNVGSFVTGLAFPYITAWFAASALVGEGQLFATKTDPFFYIAATLNVFAIFMWLLMSPKKPLLKEAVS